MNKETQIALLKKYRIPIRGQSGQHLLIDPNLQKKLTDFLPVQAGDSILEIGPGLGALTAQFLQKGVRVTAIEKDARFVEILKEVFAAEIADGLLVLINEDVLTVNMPELFEFYKIRNVISNLPYYITGPVLFQVFQVSHYLQKAVFMMQTEVAERLCSTGGSKVYGRLSVMAQFYAQIDHGCNVPPQCFAPPPDVHSTVLRFDFEKGLRHRYAVNPERLEAFIKIAFSQRRKILLSVLKKQNSFPKASGEWTEIFKRAGIDEKMRPEQVDVESFLRLFQEVGS